MIARGGKLSTLSGLGSTHHALVNRLDSGLIEGYELGEIHEYPISKNPIKRILRRWISGPKTITRKSIGHDIVHITDQEQAGLTPSDSRSVVTIHDLFHLFPTIRDNVIVGDQNPSLIRRKDITRIKNGIARASLLICVSKDTQQECEMRFPGIPTVWIPHAIELESYRTERPIPNWFDKGVNLLVIGSEEPRKRIEFVVNVCAGMNVTLHKIGAESSPASKDKISQLAKKVGCKLNWVGRVSEDEKIAALQHADALLFPSVAEGFGLPPLEAYAAGTVALVADYPAHNEIPLEHHILPHDDINMWRAAIEELQDESEEVIARASEFSVKRWAERHIEAYNSLF